VVPALLVLQLKLWVPDGAVMRLSLEQDRGASRRLIWSSGAPPVSRVWGGICGIRPVQPWTPVLWASCDRWAALSAWT
jgi:hypothetical protein